MTRRPFFVPRIAVDQAQPNISPRIWVKRCSRCRQTKPVSDFRLVRATGRPSSWCKQCQYAATREWRTHSVEQRAAWRRRYYLRTGK